MVPESKPAIAPNPSNPGQMQINIEELQKHNIFFATPCYGGQLTDQFFLSMFRLTQALNHYKINYRITTLRNESLVTRARNILTAMFLESDCTHLMFIDADIEFEPDSVIRMLAMNKPLIAAAYPKKTIDWDNVRKAAIEVMDASTGFFLVQRIVFEKMIQAYPELHYKNDSSIDPRFNPHCYALFDTWLDPDDNRYLSEDYTFCRRWQKIGGKIWLDPNTRLSHVGAFTVPGDVSRLFGRREAQ